MIIEETTTYAYKLKYIENVSFGRIRAFAQSFVNELPQELVDDIYDQLKRGLDLLQNEPQMLVYLYSFGKMHEAKLQYAFDQLPDASRKQHKINIIDYGCGQAIGTMCYADFLRENGIKQSIGTITLIEPSEICLRRAALHAKTFFPDAKIRTVCKGFDDLEAADIQCNESTPTLHILSNVLDILDFDLKRFAKLINGQLCGYNQFICVGPYFGFSDKDERMEEFTKLLNADTTFAKELDKYELNDNKTWTCQTRICSVGKLKKEKLSTVVTEDDIRNGIEDEYGVVYSKNGKRLLKNNNKELKSYKIKIGTEVICDNAFHDIDKYFGIGLSFFGHTNLVLEEIEIPNTVKIIGEGAFCWCELLNRINIPNSVTEIAASTFCGCKSLTQIELPDSIVVIGKSAFEECVALKKINLPKSITHIGNSAFWDCTSLEVVVPESVTDIGYLAFEVCKSVEFCYSEHYIVENGMVIDKHKGEINSFLVCADSIIIPDTVKYLGQFWPFHPNNFKQIVIPDSITAVEEDVFENCGKLQQIIIPYGSADKWKKVLPKGLWDKLYYLKKAVEDEPKKDNYSSTRRIDETDDLPF